MESWSIFFSSYCNLKFVTFLLGFYQTVLLKSLEFENAELKKKKTLNHKFCRYRVLLYEHEQTLGKISPQIIVILTNLLRQIS